MNCPACKTESTEVIVEQEIDETLRMRRFIQPGVSVNAAAAGDRQDREAADEHAAGSSEQFDIAYIAGVHVTGANEEAKYKVVWMTKDIKVGESRSEWATLDYVVQMSAKVRDFHSRWNIRPLNLLQVGFKWEHELPTPTRGKKWRCPHDGCIYMTETECNCRKHIGSVHGQLIIRCLHCGSKQSTVSNLNKHMKKCHGSETAAHSDAAANL